MLGGDPKANRNLQNLMLFSFPWSIFRNAAILVNESSRSYFLECEISGSPHGCAISARLRWTEKLQLHRILRVPISTKEVQVTIVP